jgi:hypothetical protein
MADEWTFMAILLTGHSVSKAACHDALLSSVKS